MSRSPTKAADFLKAMQAGEEAETPPPPQPANQPIAEPPPVQTTPARTKPAKSPAQKRSELKHFGGYLDEESLEKIALLRVRLKKDNSQLIKLAIDDLFRKHTAKRAFGDA